MKSTSRLRVLSHRIPWVLVFVYFCRELSGNTEERPTRRDYIEISTCRTIILHLEDSRSHGKEAEAERGQALGARPLTELDLDSLSGLISTDLKDRITVQSMSVWSNGPYSLEGTIKPDPLAPGGESLSTLIHYSSREKKPLIKIRATTSIRYRD